MVKRVLISVSNKTGIVEFAKSLHELGAEIISTGGTAEMLRSANLPVTDVSAITKFPEIMDGRVKTLHPAIHGAILADLSKKHHQEALQQQNITPIDMVVVNLYPFEQTVANGASFTEIIEQIDIGGPAMIRAAAKNHNHITIVTDISDYPLIISEIQNKGSISKELKKKLALKAFQRTAAYDSAISAWLAETEKELFPSTLTITAHLQTKLRYGENPHQKAALYKIQNLGNPATDGKIINAKQLQGKELSYNNINDTNAAWSIVCDFSEPCVAIIKHANPCGVAISADVETAFVKALACDPTSAYGGIIALNRPLTYNFVQTMGKLFVEVIIAPEIEDKAAAFLAEKKKNLRLLEVGNPETNNTNNSLQFSSISGGLLVQETDDINIQKNDVSIVGKITPSAALLEDMIFAFRVCKHVKSNAIILAKDGATIGIGAGQMSRIDSIKIACFKAEAANIATKGSVLASDAFFPFADNVIHAAKAGIAALIHPGGSIRDEEVIAAADDNNITIATTSIRHFRH